MDQIITVNRTLHLQQNYAVTSDQPLTPEVLDGICNALRAADTEYLGMIHSTSAATIQPLSYVDEDAFAVEVTLGVEPAICIDNEIGETIPLDIGDSMAEQNTELDGKLESISTCDHACMQSFRLFVPDLYRNAEFLHWLETSKALTMHQRGTGLPHWDDWADVVIFVDPSLSGEGSDSDMPGHDLVVDRIKQIIGNGPFFGYHFPVVLTNVEK